MGRTIAVSILADSRELVSQMKKAEGSVKEFGDAAQQQSSKSDKAIRAINTGAKFAAAGLAVAAGAAFKWAKMAAEDQASAAKLATTLQNTTGATKAQVAAVEDWITKQGQLFGVSDDDLRPALSKLATATGSVTKAQNLASLAMNISAGTGKSLESVSQAVAKAYATHNVAALGKYGVAVKDANGKALSFAQVQKELAQKFAGQSAAAANTLSGKMQRMKVAISEAQESIGYLLLPALTKLANFIATNVVPKIQSIVAWTQKHTKATAIIVGVLASLAGILITVSIAIKVVTAVTKAYAAVQKALNFVMEANPIGLVVIALAALAIALVIAYKKSDKFRSIVNASFKAVKTVVKDVAGFITKTVPAAFQKVIDWIKSHWKVVAVLIGGPIALDVIAIKDHFADIRNGISNVIGWIKDVPGKIKAVADNFASAGKSLITSLLHGMVSAAHSAGGFVASLVQSVKNAINDALNLPLSIDVDKGPFHLHQTIIPRLASGGIVTSPTLALIGEAGPEAVVPLGRAGMGTVVNNYYTVKPMFSNDTSSARELKRLQAIADNAGVRTR